MKIRCTDNSIRIRIRKSELDQLIKEKRVAAKVHFGLHISLTFVLEVDESCQMVTADFKDHLLSVVLPQEIADSWIHSTQVGIEVNQSVSEAHDLHLLIEKDFPCLGRVEEDKSDTFWELAPDSPEAC